MWKHLGKLLGGVATAAALATLIPYSRDYDETTDTQKTQALLWTLKSVPGQDGKRSYHFTLGKEESPLVDLQTGEARAEEDTPAEQAPAKEAAAAETAAEAEPPAKEASAEEAPVEKAGSPDRD